MDGFYIDWKNTGIGEGKNKYEPETIIWRYMDITKFIDLLRTEELYFSNIKYFNDPAEGYVSKVFEKNFFENYTDPALRDIEKKYVDEKKDEIYCQVVNCWNACPYESVAMWKGYTNELDGIAIKSTVWNLTEAIHLRNYKNNDKINICYGKVEYVDDKNLSEENKVLIRNLYLEDRLLLKNITFEYEKEIRIIIKENHEIDNYRLKIDLQKLIDTIYIVPTAPKYYVDGINSLIKKYGYNFNVVQSDIYRK